MRTISILCFDFFTDISYQTTSSIKIRTPPVLEKKENLTPKPSEWRDSSKKRENPTISAPQATKNSPNTLDISRNICSDEYPCSVTENFCSDEFPPLFTASDQSRDDGTNKKMRVDELSGSSHSTTNSEEFFTHEPVPPLVREHNSDTEVVGVSANSTVVNTFNKSVASISPISVGTTNDPNAIEHELAVPSTIISHSPTPTVEAVDMIEPVKVI